MKKEKRWRNEMWKTVLFLFFAFTVVSCSDDSDENSIPWYEDATALQLAYDAGVADASVPEASEVVNTLVSITTPEAHPDQEWMKVDDTQMVLVSCMTNKASLKYWQATDTFRITKELWVTVPSEWEKKRLDFVNMDSVSTRMRMVQMLGLPPSSNYEVVIEGIKGCNATGFSKKESHQQASKETLQRLRREPQFIDAIFAAKADRTKMEEEPVMAAPDIDKLQEEQQNFIIEQEKPVEPVAVAQRQTKKEDDDFSLDDITTTPREKTREEIIAEAEAAAFAEE